MNDRQTISNRKWHKRRKQKIINEIIITNKKIAKNKEPLLGQILEEKIKWVRENIPAWSKEKWDWLETIIEKSAKVIYDTPDEVKEMKWQQSKKIDSYMDIDYNQ